MAKKLSGITIEINAETKGLDKALKDVNSKASQTATELREVEKLLKFNPKDTELLAQKQKLLGEQVGISRDKLDQLKNAEKQVQAQFEKGEIGEQQYRELQREVVETESKLKHYESQLKQVNTEKKKLSQSIQDVSGKLGALGQKMSSVGKSMTTNITAPILAIGVASIKAFNEVDNGLDIVTKKTGATGNALFNMQDTVKEIAVNIPADFEEIGNAVGEINTQFGLTGKSLEQASEQMLKFSNINGQDVTSSTIGAKGAIEAYGLQAKDLNSVLDAVTKTAQNTGVATDKIFDSVTKGAPQLRALGLDFTQSSEVMGRFEQKGLDSSKALTYMSKAQVTFAKEGKTLSTGLDELIGKIQNSSSETEKLTMTSEYFGTKGATFMLDAIQRGALDFNDFENASKSASGAVTQTFNDTLDPIDKSKTAMNSFKLAGAGLGETIQTTLSPILDKLSKVFENINSWLNSLSPETKETIVNIALFAAAVGPVVLVLGKVAGAISTIISLGTLLAPIIAGISAPVVIAVAVFAALVAAGIAIYKNWDKIKEKLTQFKDFMFEKFNAIKEFFKKFKLKALEIPKPKLPKFKLEGEFSLSPPSVPKLSIEWNADGAIFAKPYIFGNQGVGEAGPEAVLPISKLAGIMADTLDKMGVVNNYGGDIVIEQMIVRDDNDIKMIANELNNLKRDVKGVNRNLGLAYGG